MDLQTLKSVSDAGLGTAAAVVLVYGGYKALKFMDLLVNNHLAHIQTSLEEVNGNIKDMSKTMSDLADSIKELARK